MKFGRLSAFVLVVFLATGCSARYVSAPIVPLTGGVIESSAFHADIELGPVVTGEAVAFRYFMIFRGGPTQLAGDVAGADPVSLARAGAVFNALSGTQGDVLIAPKFEMTISNSIFGTSARVKVTGYRGTVKGVTRAR